MGDISLLQMLHKIVKLIVSRQDETLGRVKALEIQRGCLVVLKYWTLTIPECGNKF